MAFTKAVAVKDVPEGKGKKVSLNGKEIAILNLGGKFFALDNKCTHAGGPLSAGKLDGNGCCVECPWHGSVFDLKSGKNTAGPAKRPVAVYKTKVEGNDVLVDV